jgi:hypothetical protein
MPVNISAVDGGAFCPKAGDATAANVTATRSFRCTFIAISLMACPVSFGSRFHHAIPAARAAHVQIAGGGA